MLASGPVGSQPGSVGLREEVTMASRLESVVVDTADPRGLARWWAEALGWAVTAEAPGEVAVEPPDGLGVPLVFVPVAGPKLGKNRLHLDLASGSVGHQAAQVDRLVGLGARPVDIGQGDVPWVVLADPEGNELCVLDPRPEYTATGGAGRPGSRHRRPGGAGRLLEPGDRLAAGRVGRAVVVAAVGVRPRPLPGVHQGRRPQGGQEPAAPGPGPHGRFEPGSRGGPAARLRALGAAPADVGRGEVSWVVLADPEGNEFCVLTPRPEAEP